MQKIVIISHQILKKGHLEEKISLQGKSHYMGQIPQDGTFGQIVAFLK